MRLKMGPEFRDQCMEYSFRFCCEHCTYLDRDLERCVHGWPFREHRLGYYDDPEASELVFCKEFELL